MIQKPDLAVPVGRRGRDLYQRQIRYNIKYSPEHGIARSWQRMKFGVICVVCCRLVRRGAWPQEWEELSRGRRGREGRGTGKPRAQPRVCCLSSLTCIHQPPTDPGLLYSSNPTKIKPRACEMAQQLTALATEPDNPSSIPMCHMAEGENQFPHIVL